MTVKELIEILQKAPQDAEVRCTWESIEPEIDGIYIDRDGAVLIDSDGNFYMDSKADPNREPLYVG